MRTFLLSLLVALVVVQPSVGQERPFVHPLFTNHMVFQRGIKVPVWGWAEPGSLVEIEFQGEKASAKADESGRWQVRLGPFTAGGPYELKIRGPEDVNLQDVMVGDVWLCSGQSNMAWPVSRANDAEEEIAAANYPKIRLFTVPNQISYEPQETVEGTWQTCSPKTVPQFSAVGYFFGRALHEQLDVPIGLIHSSWGGTVAEAWTSAEALEGMKEFQSEIKEIRKVAAALNADGEESQEELIEQWYRTHDPGSQKDSFWASPAYEDSDWSTMSLPTHWEIAGLPDFDGICWFRREISLDSSWEGKKATLQLGPIDDADTVWINGKKAGTTMGWNKPRSYDIPSSLLKEGTNVVAIRVLDTGGEGGLRGQPNELQLTADGLEPNKLAGKWRCQASVDIKELPPLPHLPGTDPNVPTVLYNGMIAPLVSFPIKGAIWYQGESNAGRPVQYRKLLPTMIDDWRNRFQIGDFPFLIVQLANYMEKQQQPVETGWAMIREAQWLTSQDDDSVGLAVTTDIGEANDIHPRNKQDVGSRLALQARKIAYGEDVVAAGPEYVSHRIEGSKVRVQFSSVGDGLTVHGDTLKGFAIAGEDGQFQWATAEIQDDTVVLSSTLIDKPVAVRYNWANNPIGNLFNKKGLPAAPFRTDQNSME